MKRNEGDNHALTAELKKSKKYLEIPSWKRLMCLVHQAPWWYYITKYSEDKRHSAPHGKNGTMISTLKGLNINRIEFSPVGVDAWVVFFPPHFVRGFHI